MFSIRLPLLLALRYSASAHSSHRRRALVLLPFLTVLVFGVAAHAGTITAGVYSLQGASVNGYAVTGTVTFNSAGNATAANLTYENPDFSDPGLPDVNQVAISNVYNGLSQNYLSSSSGAGQIALYLNTAADANGRFNLCLAGTQCGTASGTIDPATLQIYGFYNSTSGTSNSGLAPTGFTSGYLQQVSNSAAAISPAAAPTPEPSTFVLLGTACLAWLASSGGGSPSKGSVFAGAQARVFAPCGCAIPLARGPPRRAAAS